MISRGWMESQPKMPAAEAADTLAEYMSVYMSVNVSFIGFAEFEHLM
jgi:hypothetical protein